MERKMSPAAGNYASPERGDSIIDGGKRITVFPGACNAGPFRRAPRDGYHRDRYLSRITSERNFLPFSRMRKPTLSGAPLLARPAEPGLKRWMP
jgi:hypothetical protein